MYTWVYLTLQQAENPENRSYYIMPRASGVLTWATPLIIMHSFPGQEHCFLNIPWKPKNNYSCKIMASYSKCHK